VPTTAFSKLLRRVASLPASESAPVFVPGDRVGRFEIVRELGRGGFGVVHEARDTDLGRHVAIKTLKIAVHDRPRFTNEATTAARLNHPNIVTLHDHGVHDGTPYLVLELLEGQTLRRRLDEGALSVPQVRDLAIQLCRALVHAHGARVIHRDVKPENVFIRDDGLIKLLDFGVSWARPSDAEDSSGTRGYMAPEQARGEPHDGRADIYALGVVLFEAATGHRPELGELDRIPDAVAQPIARALAPAPDARPTAEELLAMLSERAVGEGAQPYRWLEAFREDDARWFFGRDREIARLRLLLETRAVIVLAGPSGAGKSSLVHAGLVPRLVEEHWRVLSVRVGERPSAEMFARLGVDASWREHPGRLGEELRRTDERALVFVDQAEQLVAWPAEDRDAFLHALFSAADDARGPVRVILAVRDDFLIQLAQSERIRDELGRNLLLLAPPDAEQLMAALVQPAQRLGFTFEAGLDADIVSALQVVQPGAPTADAPYRSATRVDTRIQAAPLPLLQLAASRLWELRDEATRTIPRSALAKLGGMSGLLAHHADDVLHGLAPAERAVARRILTSLVTPERMRRSVERERLIGAPGAHRVLDQLIAGRLVTGGEQVELAHESLITGWSQLRSWLDDDEARITMRDRIAAAALHWHESGRPRELLWRGTPLADALTIVDDLAGRDRDFIAAARARARGRRRIVAWLAAVASLLAVVATIAAVRASRIAARTRDAARVQAILRRAELAEDPVVSAMLFAELGDNEPPGGTAAALRVGGKPVPLAVLRGHTTPLFGASISHDGKRVVTCASDSCRLWPIDGRGAPTILPAGAAVWAPDDSALFMIKGRRDLAPDVNEIHKVALDGTTLKVYKYAGAAVNLLPLPDGRIVVATRQGSIVMFDGDNVKVIAEHTKAPGFNTAAIFTLLRMPDGRVLSAGGMQAIVSGGDGPPLVLEHPNEFVRCARALPDGRIVTIAGHTLRLWPADGGTPKVLATDALERVTANDGNLVVVRGPGMPILVYVLAVGDQAAAISLDGERLGVIGRRRGWIAKMVVAANGAVAIARDSGIATVDFIGGSITLAGHSSAGLTNLEASTDGRILVTSGMDGTARVWRFDEAPAMKVVRGAWDFIGAMRFSPDGSRLLTGSFDKGTRVWDVARVERLQQFEEDDGLRCVEWMANGKIFVATAKSLRIRDGDRLVRELRPPQKPGALFKGDDIGCGAISPDGKLAVAATMHGLYLFDVATGDVREIGDWKNRVAFGFKHATFSPDGKWMLASLAWDQVYLWRLDDSAPPIIFQANRDPRMGRVSAEVAAAYFFPDGQRIVTADGTAEVRVWSRDGKEDRSLARSGGKEARPSRDGRKLVITGNDATIETLGPKRERLVLVAGDDYEAVSAELSPDGRRAATANHMGIMRLWWVTWPDLVARFRASTTACLSVEQRKELLEEPEPRAKQRFAECERRNGR